MSLYLQEMQLLTSQNYNQLLHYQHEKPSICLFETKRKILWLRHLLEELGSRKLSLIQVEAESQGSILLASN